MFEILEDMVGVLTACRDFCHIHVSTKSEISSFQT